MVFWATISTTKAQTILYNQDFSALIPANMTLINSDGLTVNSAVVGLFGTDAWVPFLDSISPTVDDTCAASTSWYTPAGTSSDWLITPAITITGTNPILSWNARAVDATYPDGYEVRVGTSPTIAALTTVLYSTAGENTTWTARSASLNAYIGQTIYVAIVNNSNDKFILLIDDIKVVSGAPLTYDLAVSGANPSEYTSIPLSQATSPFTVGATVTNTNANTVTNVVVNARVTNLSTSTVVSTQTLTGPASLAGNATANVTGTAVANTGAAAYEFRYIVSMTESDNNTLNDTSYKYVVVDDNLYARDNAFIYGSLSGTLGIRGTAIEIAQKYQVTNATNLFMDTVFAFIGEKRVGARYRAKVYTSAGTTPVTAIATGNTFTVTAADTVGGVGIIGLTFPAPLNVGLAGNGTYFVAVEQMDTFNYGLGYNSGIYTANANYYSTNGGTSWTGVSTQGFNVAFVIWPRVYTSVTCNLVASATATGTTCNLANGSATTTVTGNTGTPTYLWSNNATTANLTNVAAGTYIVTVTEGSCTDTAKVVIANTGSVPTFTLSSTQATCNNANGTATVNGAPTGSTYLWGNNGTTATISGLVAGNYPVTVTNSGCTATQSVDVTSTGSFTPVVTSTNTTCALNNGTATVTSPTGATYNWSNGLSTASISGLAANSYTVTVTSNGCTATATATVAASTGITASATATNASCGVSDGSATVTPSPAGTYSYLWSNGGNTATISNIAAGAYTVTVTATTGGCTATATANVNNIGGPTVTVNGTNPLCFGAATGTATAVPAGGTGVYSYLWSNGGTTANISNLAAGSYTVTVTAGTCVATGSYTVVAPSQINVNASSSGVSCFGASNGAATAVASGGTGTLNYTWSNNATTASLSNLTAGTYSVTVRDANQCSATATTVVSTPAQINASATSTAVGCFGGANGSATVVASGGTGSLTYNWSSTPAQSTATAAGLTAGAYTVTVKDANNCSVTASATVAQPAAALTVATATTANSATATPAGGTTPYTYNWSSTPAQTTATASGLTPGSYTVTVTDARQCTATATVVLTAIENTNANIASINVYPNPSNGVFNVNLQLNKSEEVSLRLTDITGKVIMLSNEAATTSLVKEINMPNLAVGSYILSVTSASGTANFRVLVK